MNELALSILGPAFMAGLLVLSTHVPLGRQVLKRGIVFIDLAIAQIAGLGVIAADLFGWEPQGFAVQVAAFSAALAGAVALRLSERYSPEVQEATIGVAFVLAASLGILLLAGNPHGGEHLQDLLVGQILWVSAAQLVPAAVLSAIAVALWFGFGERLGRIGFYLIFAAVVTVSVQMVGVYLVFASLIIPALASRRAGEKVSLWLGYAVGAAGYVLGLMASLRWDVPAGATIVCAMAATGAVAYALIPTREGDARSRRSSDPARLDGK